MSSPAEQTPAWLAGSGEMSGRIRHYDWAATEMGPLDAWPQSLRTAVGIMIATRHPVFMFWGPEHRCLYNDACAALLGPEKHPSALGGRGRDIWPEAWPIVGPQIEQVMSGGEAAWHEDHRIPLCRHGRPKEVYWTCSYAPITDADAPNGVAGVLVLCNDTTEAVLARQASEKRLHESDELMRIALASVRMGIWEWNLQDRMVRGDPMFMSFYDLPASEEWLPDSEFLTRISAVGADRIEAIARSEVVAGQELEGEILLRRGSQGDRWLAWRARVTGSDPVITQGVCYDVTAQKQAELAQRESEKQLRDVIDGMREGFFILDPDFRIVHVNPMALAANRRSASDVLGRTCWDIWPAIVGTPLEEALRHAMTEREPVDIEHHYDDHVTGLDLWLNARILPIPGGIALLTRDITTRKQAEAAVIENAERLRLALEIGGLSTWEFDLVSGESKWSDEHYRMLGYAPGEVTPSVKAWAARIHPADFPAVETEGLRARDSHEEYAQEYRLLLPDGTLRWASTRGRFIYDADGTPLRIVGVMQDVTERRLWEDTQQVLIAELQHRTRNLLAVVRSVAAQTLRTGTSLESFAREFNSRLSALSRVQGLLSQAGGQSVLLDELVRSELTAHGAVIDGGRVVVGGRSVRLPSKAVQVLTLALHELATNAVKYGALSQDGARLSVSWGISQRSGKRQITIRWFEEGVKLTPLAADRRGYGRELIERALPYDLGAETSLSFAPDGVRCEIKLLLEIERIP